MEQSRVRQRRAEDNTWGKVVHGPLKLRDLAWLKWCDVAGFRPVLGAIQPGCTYFESPSRPSGMVCLPSDQRHTSDEIFRGLSVSRRQQNPI